MQADGAVNLGEKRRTDPHIFRCIPAAHTFALQISVEPFSEGCILAGVRGKEG
jgi:hypothetical protein